MCHWSDSSLLIAQMPTRQPEPPKCAHKLDCTSTARPKQPPAHPGVGPVNGLINGVPQNVRQEIAIRIFEVVDPGDVGRHVALQVFRGGAGA